jgi:hypothetical protein
VKLSLDESLVKVVRTVVKDIDGLGAQIKAAREKDKRKLTKICAEADMTTANWYRIEGEKQDLPEETLRRVEAILGIDFGVTFD